MPVEFHKVVRKTRFLLPPEFKPEEQTIEYRKDPLTGAGARINIKRVGRSIAIGREEDMHLFIEQTRQGCPFCPENVTGNTPLFTSDILREGSTRNRGYLFPNRFPFAEYHGVATFGDAHFVNLDGFTVEQVRDNLLTCQQLVLSVNQSDREAKYPVWLWNHLPPSAGSIIHPHTQILMDKESTPLQSQLLQTSEDYFSKNGGNYWQDLVMAEKKLDQRYIAEEDSLHLLASFAPTGNREVAFIFKKASSFADLDEKQIIDFAGSIVAVLRWYKEQGINSFNLSTFSAEVGQKRDSYLLNARIMSRPVFRAYYTAFGGPLELWHHDCVIETLPEETARQLKLRF